MSSIEEIQAAIQNEYRTIKGQPAQFDRKKLPRVLFYMEEKPPSMLAKLKQKDFHSILHKIFNLPVIGRGVNAVFLLARLPHHIHKIRAELFELRMELRKFEGQFSSDHRQFTSQTRQRFEKIEQTIKRLEQ